MSLAIRVGDPLPSVGLRATDGYLLNLRSFVTKQPVAFLFFGGPTLRGAARQRGVRAAEALARGFKRLSQAGIAVVGVSCDSEEQQTEFVAAAKLPYLLFSDERRTAVKMLGIHTTAEGANVNVARHIVLVADRDGIVCEIVDKVEPETLVDRILRVFARPKRAAAAAPRSPMGSSAGA